MSLTFPRTAPPGPCPRERVEGGPVGVASCWAGDVVESWPRVGAVGEGVPVAVRDLSEHAERRGNWWRWRCAWVGHLYVGITSYPEGTSGVACLRCHGMGWKRPTF